MKQTFDEKHQTTMQDVDNLQYPQGLKWTKQRKNIYSVLWEASEPLSAVQIFNLAVKKADGEEYALSTIYRIMAAFEEKGLVEKTTWMGDGTVVYALNRGGHTHYAICLECHKRIPLQSCPCIHLHPEREVEDFTVTGHKLELYGYCNTCKNSEKVNYGLFRPSGA